MKIRVERVRGQRGMTTSLKLTFIHSDNLMNLMLSSLFIFKLNINDHHRVKVREK